ncbi:MAG TPA: zinc-ribbon domain-containing protein [Hymenobacter sp.]|nr:zinc-ribbon domain-containing protein [Hymenobacter sp.]
MLFFFGTGTSHITTVPLPGLVCAHCGNSDTITSTVTSRYLHIFWIPLLPIGKSSATVCHHCKQVLTSLYQMPTTYREPVQAIQKLARVPLTNYALSLLFGVGVAFIVVVGVIAQLTGSEKSSAGTVAAGETSSVVAGSVVTDAEPNDSEAVADYEKKGTRYKINIGADGSTYCFAKVTKVTPDSVYYRLTKPLLRQEPSDAMASVALRDSVTPGYDNLSLAKEQWVQVTTGQGTFKRFD